MSHDLAKSQDGGHLSTMAETFLNVHHPSIVLCCSSGKDTQPVEMLNISRFASKLRNLWVNSTKEGITLKRSVLLLMVGIFKIIFLKSY